MAVLDGVARLFEMSAFQVAERHTWEQVWIMVALGREKASKARRDVARQRSGTDKAIPVSEALALMGVKGKP